MHICSAKCVSTSRSLGLSCFSPAFEVRCTDGQNKLCFKVQERNLAKGYVRTNLVTGELGNVGKRWESSGQALKLGREQEVDLVNPKTRRTQGHCSSLWRSRCWAEIQCWDVSGSWWLQLLQKVQQVWHMQWADSTLYPHPTSSKSFWDWVCDLQWSLEELGKTASRQHNINEDWKAIYLL